MSGDRMPAPACRPGTGGSGIGAPDTPRARADGQECPSRAPEVAIMDGPDPTHGPARETPATKPGRPSAASLTTKQRLMLAKVEADAPSRAGVFRRAYDGRSLAASVKAFCLQCVWMDPRAIRDCDDSACPLHPHRPYQGGGENDGE